MSLTLPQAQRTEKFRANYPRSEMTFRLNEVT